MWSIKTNSENNDRGGFQDRDASRSNFDKYYGPSYGVDYARFSDPPDLRKDALLLSRVSLTLKQTDFTNLEIRAKNKFVIVKGTLINAGAKDKLSKLIHEVEGVLEIIWDVKLLEERI